MEPLLVKIALAVGGMVIGYIGGHLQLSFAKKKANYDIRNENYQHILQAYAKLAGATSRWRYSHLQGQSSQGPLDELIVRIRDEFAPVSECFKNAPWAFSDEICKLHRYLNDTMLKMEIERGLMLKGRPMQFGKNRVWEGVPGATKHALDATLEMLSLIPQFDTAVSKRLEELMVEYEHFKTRGI